MLLAAGQLLPMRPETGLMVPGTGRSGTRYPRPVMAAAYVLEPVEDLDTAAVGAVRRIYE